MVNFSQKHKPNLKESIKESKFNFKYFKFNFSFMTSNNRYSYGNPEFNKNHKAALLNRIVELSSMTCMDVRALRKNNGIEYIDEKQLNGSLNCDPKFFDEEHRKNESNTKCVVFRIYTNNNPLPSRIIGKLVGNVFYVFAIDLKHEMYNG